MSSGDAFKPTDGSDQTADPTTFLPKKGNLGSQDSISGYLVFEVDGSFDLSSLQYEQDGVTLTIQFVGATKEVRAG